MSKEQQAQGAVDQPRFYEWQEGAQEVYLTGIKGERGTPDKPRTQIHLQFTLKPTAETFESPSTRYTLRGSLPDDSVQGVMFAERRMKQTLFKIAEVPDGEKVKLGKVVKECQARLAQADFKCSVTMKLQEGKSVNRTTGEPMMFAELVDFQILEVLAKGTYESLIDCDESDLPF